MAKTQAKMIGWIIAGTDMQTTRLFQTRRDAQQSLHAMCQRFMHCTHDYVIIRVDAPKEARWPWPTRRKPRTKG